jgi:hypothetical protein
MVGFYEGSEVDASHRSQINDAMIFFSSGENDVPSNFV